MRRLRHARGIGALVVGALACLLAFSRGPSLSPLIGWLYPRAAWIARDDLATLFESANPPLLLDARSSAEIAVSTLPHAAPYDPDLPLPHDRSIVVYCSIGWRSAAVAESLSARGYDVRNLEGGIFAWANEGRSVVRSGTPVAEVHPFDRVWAYWLDDELEAWPRD